MVSTRKHPRPFPDPGTPTPSRSSPESPTKSSSPPTSQTVTVSTPANTRKSRSNRTSAGKQATMSSTRFVHKIPPLLIIWLTISLPLVAWDTSYIFLRPHSMPGGKFHGPWKPYALYGTVDYVYGWPAYDSHSGFTAAQATLNVVESAMYIYYLFAIWNSSAKGLYSFDSAQTLFLGNHEKVASGPRIATAVLALFSATVMTISKTALYGFNEYYSGFANVGHNSAWNLIWLWIIPNGLWLVLPTYMAYILGHELVDGLNGNSGEKED